jgi:hypothetical protein
LIFAELYDGEGFGHVRPRARSGADQFHVDDVYMSGDRARMQRREIASPCR